MWKRQTKHKSVVMVTQHCHTCIRSDVYKVTCSATVRSAFTFMVTLISELNRAAGDYHDADLVILACVICHYSASSISEWDTKAATGSEAPFCSTRPFISIFYGEIYLKQFDKLNEFHHMPPFDYLLQWGYQIVVLRNSSSSMRCTLCNNIGAFTSDSKLSHSQYITF